MTGGSYKEDDEPYPLSAESEPAFDDLDKALLAVCPNLTLLQYKAIERDLIHRTFESRDEYYGNCTDTAYKKVSLQELYAWLVAKKILVQGEGER